MYQSRIVREVGVAGYNTNGGVAAECPTCHTVNVSLFGDDGSLVWWPNAEVGTWCRHCKGAYQGAGALGTMFLFIDGRPLSVR